eukprot:SAG31_NODE_29109_length_400_cov_1.358804_1_plen_65_part_01
MTVKGPYHIIFNFLEGRFLNLFRSIPSNSTRTRLGIYEAFTFRRHLHLFFSGWRSKSFFLICCMC